MQHEQMTFLEAVHFLAARYGMRLPEASPQQRQQESLGPLYALHQAAATFFHECLRRDPAAQPARLACRQREITQETAARFGLGYAPAVRDTLCQAMQKQGFSQELMVQSGLAVVREPQRGAYDLFRHRLMFPIHDRLGRPIAFGGRALESSEALHIPKYLNSPETPIFRKGRLLYGLALAKAALRQREQALIVEGYTDVIACHRQGVTHAVGTLGTALTEHHVGLLKGVVKEVVLVFDSDAAGGAAAERSIGLFLDAGMRVRVVTLPEGEDPDSFLRQHTGEELLRHVDEAVSFVDYLLNRAARFTDLRNPAGQADCVDRLAPLLRKIENQVERWRYAALVAERLGIPPHVLQQEIDPRQMPPGRPPHQALTRLRPLLHATPISSEYILLQTIYNDLRLVDRVQHQITPEDFRDADYRAIYTTFLRLASQGEVAVSPYIIDEVTSPKQQELLSKMAMGPVLSSQAEISKALDDCLLDIRQRQLKAQRQSIHKQLKTVGDDTAKQQQLLQEYNRLSKEQPMSFS
jgi:DNA primase